MCMQNIYTNTKSRKHEQQCIYLVIQNDNISIDKIHLEIFVYIARKKEVRFQ